MSFFESNIFPFLVLIVLLYFWLTNGRTVEHYTNDYFAYKNHKSGKFINLDTSNLFLDNHWKRFTIDSSNNLMSKNGEYIIFPVINGILSSNINLVSTIPQKDDYVLLKYDPKTKIIHGVFNSNKLKKMYLTHLGDNKLGLTCDRHFSWKFNQEYRPYPTPAPAPK